MDYRQPLDYDLFKVLPSKKVENVNQCDITYNNVNLSIRTPRVKLQDNSIIFKTHNKQCFMDFITNLELNVVNYLYANSTDIFNGKKFSFEKIKTSITPSLIVSEDGSIASLEITELDNIKCFNPFGDEISRDEIGKYVSAKLDITSIVFKKDLFKIIYQVSMVKMSKVEKNKIEEFQQVETKNQLVVRQAEVSEEITTGDFY